MADEQDKSSDSEVMIVVHDKLGRILAHAIVSENEIMTILENAVKEGQGVSHDIQLPETELVPLSEVSHDLGVSVATLTRHARLGQLKAIKLGKFWYTTKSTGLKWKEEIYRKHVSEKSESTQ